MARAVRLGQTGGGSPSMTPDVLAAVGRALYGDRWQTSLADDLHVADRTMRRWLASETSIPDRIKKELREVLVERVKAISEMLGYLVDPVFLGSVDDLELSLRSANCLKQAKIHYIGDLVRKTESDLLRIPGPPYLGRKSINELKEILAQIGLHFGMEVPGWPPKNIDDLAKAYEAGLEQLATDASG